MTSTMNIGRHAQYPLTDLNRFHKNARRGDVEAIMGSIVANGVYRPIYVNKGTYTGRPLEVLAGNHTLEAMRRLAEQNPEDPRWQTVDVWEVDVDDQRAAKIVLADNRTAELGDYDTDALVALLETVDDDLDGTGYDYDDLLEETSLTSEYISEDEPEAENEKRTTLAERFGIPPFTIFDTRQGPWIQRKNAWAPICENSAKGRKKDLIYKSPQKRYSNWYSIKKQAVKENPNITNTEIEEKYQDQLTEYANCGGTSIFNPVLAEVLLSWFAPPNGKVIDPWAGGSVRGLVSSALNLDYTGHELRQEQVDENRTQWENIKSQGLIDATKPEPKWITGDSRKTITQHPPATFDIAIGCPPYYDLEEYSDNPEDLSNLSTEDFDKAMLETLKQVDRVLKDNSFICIIVGSVRDKQGNLRDMRSLITHQSAQIGWHLANDAVLINTVGTVAITAGRGFLLGRSLGRVHQDILILVKGNRKAAAKKCGETVNLAQLPKLEPEDTNTENGESA